MINQQENESLSHREPVQNGLFYHKGQTDRPEVTAGHAFINAIAHKILQPVPKYL